MTNNNPVVGTGLYLEARRTTPELIYTMQFMLLPEGKMPSGETVPMTSFWRRLSRDHTRRNWSVSASPKTSVSVLTDPTIAALVSSVRGTAAAFALSKFVERNLTNLTKYEYELVGQPILVDVTVEDVMQARLGKTPYKVIGRINKVRKAYKYPEELVAAGL